MEKGYKTRDGRFWRWLGDIRPYALLLTLVAASAGARPAIVPDALAASDGPPKPIVFVLAASAAQAKWQAVQHAIESLAKIDLTIWYDFGSIHLQTAPENGLCRMNLTVEQELTENEKAATVTCLLDPQQFNILDLVYDGDAPRKAPPDPLPRVLKSLCR